MSKRTLVSEEDVKKALRIDSFRNISKDKIMEFVSLIPQMDKEVAIEIIKQFPEYAASSLKMIEQLNIMCDRALAANKESQADAIHAYRTVLDTIKDCVQKDDISETERNDLITKMVEVADKIAMKDSENKKFIFKMVKVGAGVMSGALILGATILGVKANSGNIPRIDDDTDDEEEL